MTRLQLTTVNALSPGAPQVAVTETSTLDLSQHSRPSPSMLIVLCTSQSRKSTSDTSEQIQAHQQIMSTHAQAFLTTRLVGGWLATGKHREA